MTPLISIIIPAYNCKDYLELTIKSVYQQSYTEWEIILVDDGSTDETPQLVDRLAAEDSRITALHQPNGKQGKARNNGIRHAKGKLIAFLDADDLWDSDKLRHQVKCLEIENVDLVFSNGYICLENNMSLRDFDFQTLTGRMQGKPGLDLFYESNRIPTSSVLCRKAALEKVGLFDESPEIQNCEDYMLWVTLLRAGFSFYGMEQKFLFYRVHSGSSTSSEINLLFPLIRTIFKFGEPDRIRKIQLLLKFRKLQELLNEKGELRKIGPLIVQFSQALYGFPFSLLIRLAWKFNKRAFNSVFWRLTTRELKKLGVSL